jgi:hypothetical protein
MEVRRAGAIATDCEGHGGRVTFPGPLGFSFPWSRTYPNLTPVAATLPTDISAFPATRQARISSIPSFLVFTSNFTVQHSFNLNWCLRPHIPKSAFECIRCIRRVLECEILPHASAPAHPGGSGIGFVVFVDFRAFRAFFGPRTAKEILFLFGLNCLDL